MGRRRKRGEQYEGRVKKEIEKMKKGQEKKRSWYEEGKDMVKRIGA